MSTLSQLVTEIAREDKTRAAMDEYRAYLAARRRALIMELNAIEDILGVGRSIPSRSQQRREAFLSQRDTIATSE